MNKENTRDMKKFEIDGEEVVVTLHQEKWWDDRGHSGIQEDLYVVVFVGQVQKRYVKHIYHRDAHSSSNDWGNSNIAEIISCEKSEEFFNIGLKQYNDDICHEFVKLK